jgi:hypothetical protein
MLGEWEKVSSKRTHLGKAQFASGIFLSCSTTAKELPAKLLGPWGRILFKFVSRKYSVVV